ncbi:class I SAM-dependent methyltransferase [Inhella crocodyli]|uniref:Class I SAM-dependent methyltransferase n=2 Tax=Inhella crocodyli TaxID=2499851 RepID=A0A3S2XZ19_9BURK|nr:class I SAM-dependent methyltransferase [Inhella crocodyli]
MNDNGWRPTPGLFSGSPTALNGYGSASSASRAHGMKQTPAHDNVNLDLLAHIPAGSRRIVEVGCANGAMARAWRSQHPDSHYVGIDIDPDYAARAAAHCQRAFAADVEQLDDAALADLFPSDCWVFGDCLEHLRDPWRMLSRIRERIDADGSLVTCIPNAQHWSVQWRLLSGQFRYEDQGLMDRTHIRWFTRQTMLEMFASTGWRVEAGVSRQVPAPQQAQALAAVGAFASAFGLDPAQAQQDATPIQYVFRLRPA